MSRATPSLDTPTGTGPNLRYTDQPMRYTALAGLLAASVLAVALWITRTLPAPLAHTGCRYVAEQTEAQLRLGVACLGHDEITVYVRDSGNGSRWTPVED